MKKDFKEILKKSFCFLILSLRNLNIVEQYACVQLLAVDALEIKASA